MLKMRRPLAEALRARPRKVQRTARSNASTGPKEAYRSRDVARGRIRSFACSMTSCLVSWSTTRKQICLRTLFGGLRAVHAAIVHPLKPSVRSQLGRRLEKASGVRSLVPALKHH